MESSARLNMGLIDSLKLKLTGREDRLQAPIVNEINHVVVKASDGHG